MKKLFDMTNPFWSFIGKLLDVIVLHTFWFVCCLPIVTFGPATTALYYVLMKEARDEGDHYYRMFFDAFKKNFKQGVPMGLIFLLGTAGLIYAAALDYNQYITTGQFYWDVLKYICIILLFIWTATFNYAFPLLARFDNTVRKHIQNGFFFAIKNLGWTIVMTIVFVAFYFLVLWFGEYILILLVLGFGLIVFLDSYILNYIFKPYVEQYEKQQEEEREKKLLEEAEAMGMAGTDGVWPPRKPLETVANVTSETNAVEETTQLNGTEEPKSETDEAALEKAQE